MTFSAYIQRQKSLIRSRRAFSAPAERANSECPARDSVTIFKELALCKGLNTEERLRYVAHTDGSESRRQSVFSIL